MCVCVDHHCRGEEWDKTESPQFPPEISGLVLARGWTEIFPPQSGGVLTPHHCPALLTAPCIQVGVLVTANICVGLAGGRDPRPSPGL